MNAENETLPGYRWLSWTLRIGVLIIALYIEMFSLDVLKAGFPFWKTVLAFVIHSIPSFAIFIVLLIALKWEHIAGFSLIFFALMGTLPIGPPNDKNISTYIILGMMTLVGILLVLNYFMLGNRRMEENL